MGFDQTDFNFQKWNVKWRDYRFLPNFSTVVSFNPAILVGLNVKLFAAKL